MSHVDDNGFVQMVDVGGKAPSQREAIVRGTLKLTPEHAAAIGSLPKGDALTIAQVAGILGAKRCSDLIPLCHPIPLSFVDVRLTVEHHAIQIEATTRTNAETGVEMEAYTAVVVAGITLVDMLKSVGPDLTLTDIQLAKKTGGKADWRR